MVVVGWAWTAWLFSSRSVWFCLFVIFSLIFINFRTEQYSFVFGWTVEMLAVQREPDDDGDHRRETGRRYYYAGSSGIAEYQRQINRRAKRTNTHQFAFSGIAFAHGVYIYMVRIGVPIVIDKAGA